MALFGLAAQFVTKATSGIKTLISNAQIGKAATSAGYVQGVLSPSQQNQNNSITSSPNFLLYVFGFILLVIGGLVALFSRKK